MTFEQVAEVVVDGLPDSAYRYRTWWTSANNSAQSRYGWLAAGYQVARVDLTSRLVCFTRSARRPPATADAVRGARTRSPPRHGPATPDPGPGRRNGRHPP